MVAAQGSGKGSPKKEQRQGDASGDAINRNRNHTGRQHHTLKGAGA